MHTHPAAFYKAVICGILFVSQETKASSSSQIEQL